MLNFHTNKFYTAPVTDLRIMCDSNDSRADSEGLSAHLKRTVVMSICRPQAFQHRSTVYIYTFIWMEAKRCGFSNSQWHQDSQHKFSVLALVPGPKQISSRIFR